MVQLQELLQELPSTTPPSPPKPTNVPGPARPARPSWAFTDNFLEEMQQVPLFMTHQPEDIEENCALAALQTLKFEGNPKENAYNFKELGNEHFRMGRSKYQHALKYYTQALDQNCDDVALNVVCLINRAAVNLALGNNGKVLSDCSKALKLDPHNIKAFYRSTKALMALERGDEAVDCCECGLKQHPKDQSLLELLSEARKLKEKLAAIEKKKQDRINAETERLNQLKAALEDAKVKFTDSAGRSVQPDFKSSRCVKLDPESGYLSWPVIFMYPEFQESDYIQQFNEYSTFKDHLVTMFQVPAPWDSPSAPQYTPDTIDIYFESPHPTSPTLVKVGSHCLLRKVLEHPRCFITDGIPAFIILSRTSPFTTGFLARYRK